jgi:hypothetical protein
MIGLSALVTSFLVSERSTIAGPEVPLLRSTVVIGDLAETGFPKTANTSPSWATYEERIERAALSTIRLERPYRANGPLQALDVQLDASSLENRTVVYTVSLGGNVVGETITQVSRDSLGGDDLIRVTSSGSIGGSVLTHEVVFMARTFTGLTAHGERGLNGVTIRLDLRLDGNQITGSLSLVGKDPRQTDIKSTVPAGTILPGMEDLAVWLADFEEHKSLKIRTFSPLLSETYIMGIDVVGDSTLSVAAGEFETYELSVTGAHGSARVFARKAWPHIVLKNEPIGQGAVVEAKEIR